MVKRFLRFSAIFIIITLIVVGLAACSRSASKGTTPTASGSKPPVPGGKTTEQTMGQFGDSATATAVAAAVVATEKPTTPQETAKETPAAVTATPAVEVVGPVAAAATPTTAVVVVVSTPVKPTSYTLQKGEFPYCIARRFNVNPSELLNLNGLNLDSQVYPGKVLKIPQTSNTFPANRALLGHPTDYTVKSGDTVYAVACLYGDVSPEMIAQANGLSAPYALTAGAKIRIP